MISSPLTNPSFTLPPLENGDRLTRQEFEQRYGAMAHIKKAELIEGIVYMASPLRAKAHGEPHARMMAWLGSYWAATPGIQLLDNATLRLDVDNEVQPDALLRIESGGQSIISHDDYIEGAPELIVEIAASSASSDLHQKFNVYRRNQIQEYIVWRVYDAALDWFCLNEGKYQSLVPNSSGLLCSPTFPGLWLNPTALLAGDLATVLNVLQQGLKARMAKDGPWSDQTTYHNR
ncbi:Uma2 family endonuclease [Leptothoe sp. PORK10 BA2]|uniref:Uma2 family endonuclease n=1 Tax=Leptothoe sp. PORK10 BA2 TaxID=3110254 RepID=UPI002B205DD1|nr:Uma2 family endonuclease [Leptothoe sp. PORK10 BA2]MEA5466386.1 Uma2 family endonuclease [Leptothoe sp. PORK10 BA2]